MNLQSNDFDLFGVPQSFQQDESLLDTNWKRLQREAHPDRFAAQGPSAQRIALQWSVRINEAYRRLKNPLKRAAYLCELRGAPIEAESNTSMAGEFLMQQMDWREALDDAQDLAAVSALEAEVKAARDAALAQTARLLDVAGDPVAAAQQVRALMFIARFAEDVASRADQLGQ